MTVAPMPAGRGLALLANVADGQRRDGPPQLVIRRKHPVVAMPVLPRRGHEIGQTVHKLKWRELDDAIGPRPRGLSATTPSDPGGGLVPREHVADLGNVAVWAASHGEPFQGKGWPGAIPQQVFQALKIARHVAIDERDPDTGVD